MEDIIIIAVIILMAGVGIYSTVKHMKGQGGCCGGGSSCKPKKKKLANVICRKTFQVEGMHCKHCKYRVEEAVNDIRGVAGKADLKKGRLTVSYAEEVDDAFIIARIEKAGYTVIGVKRAGVA